MPSPAGIPQGPPLPDRGLSRLPHLLNGGMIVFLFAFALATYDSLPDPFPVHFNGTGTPDGWSRKSLLNWLLLPLTSLVLTLLVAASARLVDLARRRPRWLNIPHKEEFLALPPEKQEPVWRKLKSLIHWLAVPMNGIILYAQLGIYGIATGSFHILSLLPVLALVGTLVVMSVGMIIQVVRTVRRAVREGGEG